MPEAARRRELRGLGRAAGPNIDCSAIFPRARHSSACGGGGKEVRDLQADQLNFGVLYRHAPHSPPVDTSPEERRRVRSYNPHFCSIGVHVRKGRDSGSVWDS